MTKPIRFCIAPRSARLALLLSIFLSGCATLYNPVPKDYTGPVVELGDTGHQDTNSKGQFFAAVEIDGHEIQNAIKETRAASYGQGFALSSRYTKRLLPVVPMKVKLIGTHQTAAPIHEFASRMAGTFFSIEGIVDFNPTKGSRYIVTGELSKERSCVWIAHAESKDLASKRVCTQ